MVMARHKGLFPAPVSAALGFHLGTDHSPPNLSLIEPWAMGAAIEKAEDSFPSLSNKFQRKARKIARLRRMIYGPLSPS